MTIVYELDMNLPDGIKYELKFEPADIPETFFITWRLSTHPTRVHKGICFSNIHHDQPAIAMNVEEPWRGLRGRREEIRLTTFGMRHITRKGCGAVQFGIESKDPSSAWHLHISEDGFSRWAFGFCFLSLSNFFLFLVTLAWDPSMSKHILAEEKRWSGAFTFLR